jgi:hypothetical protein
MSDLATFAKLARSNAQLPVHVYLTKRSQRELKQLFQQGPRYVGHELMVPKPATIPPCRENEGRMLVRNARASNCCPTSAATARPDAQRPRQCQQHRLPAAPLDL